MHNIASSQSDILPARALPGPLHSQLMALLLRGAWRSAAVAQPSEAIAPLDLSEAELTAIAPLLLGSGAGALAWMQLRATALGTSAPAPELQQAYRLYALQKALHEREIKRVFALLEEAGLRPVLIKGWASARLYREPGLRPYGDLDLCLHPQEYHQAAALLGDTAPPHDVVTIRTASGLLEVHCGVTDLDNTQDVDIETLLARTQQVKLGDIPIRILSDEDHLRLICIHCLRHGAWRPLWFCDIAAAVEALGPDFDWPRCLGDHPRRADWVACAIGIAHHLLGAKIEHTPVAERARRLPRWLLPTVLQAWQNPISREHQTPQPIFNNFKLSRLTANLQERWLNPIEATIYLRGAFNEWPRLPWQLAMYGVRFSKFLQREGRK